MLHAENLFEVVSFFTLYDLDALLLASRELCSHATKCAEKIPTWYFGSVELNVWEDMVTFKADREPSTYISGKRNIVEVLEIALRNSIIGHLHVHCSSYYRPSTAAYLLMPTNATLMVENLHLCVQDFNGPTDLVDFLCRIRMIKDIELYGHDNGMNFEPVVNYCRQRGVESVVFEGRTLM